MTSFTRRFVIASVLVIVVLGAAGAAFAQDSTPPPPACVPDAQTACAKIVFYPATLKADLFLGPVDSAQPTAQVQQSTLWVTFANPAPGQSMDVVVKNIHDGGKDEGTLYQYPDIPKNITAPAAGQSKTVTLYPVKKFVRGKIDAKCAPMSVQKGEDVSCIVSIDGVAQSIPAPAPAPNPDGSVPPPAPPSATLAAGQKVTFVVEPGKHDVKFDLTGANASLWAPASQTRTVTVTAGTFAQVATATFNKAGHLIAKLAQADAGWVGDFYLDGKLITPQVGSIDQWVEGNKQHKVEVKNIAKTGSPLIHPYLDGTGSAYVTANGSSTVTVTMTKVPDSKLLVPTKADGTQNTLTVDSYVVWFPVWAAQTADQAEESANHFQMLVSLDGVSIGDTAPYREKARQTTNAKTCEGADHVPCYVVGWWLPLGRLAAGPHNLHAEAYPDADLFVGWTTFSGYYFTWDDNFSVSPAP